MTENKKQNNEKGLLKRAGSAIAGAVKYVGEKVVEYPSAANMILETAGNVAAREGRAVASTAGQHLTQIAAGYAGLATLVYKVANKCVPNKILRYPAAVLHSGLVVKTTYDLITGSVRVMSGSDLKGGLEQIAEGICEGAVLYELNKELKNDTKKKNVVKVYKEVYGSMYSKLAGIRLKRKRNKMPFENSEDENQPGIFSRIYSATIGRAVDAIKFYTGNDESVQSGNGSN